MNQRVAFTQEAWDSQLSKQRDLESSAMAEGAMRFRRRLEKAEAGNAASTVGGARKLLREGLADVEKAIRAMIEQPQGRGAGRRHMAAKWCEAVGADVAAYMTLKVVLDGIARRVNLRKAAFAVAELLIDELRWRKFRTEAKHLFEYKLKSFHTSSYSHMARSMNASMSFADIDTKDLELSPSMRMRLGIKLIDLLVEATGLVQLDHSNKVTAHTSKRRRHRTEITLVATEGTRAWLAKRNTEMELWTPVVLPMVVPPLRWQPGDRGGYRYALRGKFELVRRGGVRSNTKWATADMPVVYEAINTLQNTAWRINPRVLALVKEIAALGGGIAGVPKADDEELPAKPQDIDTNEEARKAWRKRAHGARERNHLRRQKAVEVAKVLSAAEAVQEERAIYFPYSLDFRGRVYPIAAYLTPQGDDFSRSLLKFADGKPMDASAARWLAIHGANCMGDTPDGGKVSKMTLDERIGWVHTWTQRIIKTADNPLADAWWAKAEKPLQFFAFCVEWANLIRANDRGEAYVCALPCSMDGSCNGLQHFAAMLRDEIGARAVNVIPQDRPQDIYHYIAEAVLEKLQQEAVTDRLAALWLGLHAKFGIVDRKLTKRPTMTFGYGSKQFGFKEQLLDYLRGHEDWLSIKAHFTVPNKEGELKPHVAIACGLMSRLIWESLGGAVVAAFAGMDWMQRAARGIAGTNRPIDWIVPATGFPVQQSYYRLERHRVHTMLAGSAVSPSVWTTTQDVNPMKQSNAIAPNFVHSLDAAALMLTVTQAFAEGVEQFAMIHDSYGTVPADCGLLARCCRQSFVRLYAGTDVIADLHSQLAAQYEDPTKCPEPPAKGELDVSGVLASDYFFA